MDKQLLDILCCPVKKTPLRMLSSRELEAVNRAIGEHAVESVTGKRLTAPLQQGLITTDGKAIYRVEDDIPVLLADEAIGTTQMNEFPRPT